MAFLLSRPICSLFVQGKWKQLDPNPPLVKKMEGTEADMRAGWSPGVFPGRTFPSRQAVSREQGCASRGRAS